MSFDAVSWAFKRQNIDAESKLLLITLANYANEWGISYPGYPNLCGKVGISDTTLWRRINALSGDKLMIKINRREGQRSLSNAYLLPEHPLATEDEFNTTMGDLGIKYDDYKAAYRSLNSEPFTLKNSDLKSSGRKSNNRLDLTKEPPLSRELESNHFSPELTEKIDETMVWLRNRKSMRHLPPQQYLDLFIELARYGIDLDGFRLYYEWLEGEKWVRKPIGVPLLKSAQTIESYLNRDKLGAKNGKRSDMQEYLAEIEG